MQKGLAFTDLFLFLFSVANEGNGGVGEKVHMQHAYAGKSD